MNDGAPAALAVLDIDLDQLARNYLYLTKKLKTGADCAAVVKADAYGLGAVPVSKKLYAQNCRHFFVATFSEGAEIRPHVADAHIYALHGPRGADAQDFTAQKITPVLNSLDDIALWSAHMRKTGAKQPALLHIDTGMNRLGLSANEVTALAADKTLLDGIDIRYAMSHLACSDDAAHSMNTRQLAAFQALTAQLGRPLRLSLANSGGIFLGPDYHFDLVRPGCSIYGINALGAAPNPMHPVVRLSARILQVRAAEAGSSIGYGASYTLESPALLATVGLGYADGYFRSLTGCGKVVIGNIACPVVGRVSMDSVVVDITALKTPPQVGDMAQIIGPQQTADDVAKQAGTIGYEVLTALGRRYERRYSGE
jgi:alanine racemase